MDTKHGEPGYEVVSPLGRVVQETELRRRTMATLDGKTIAFVWDYLFKGPEFFAAIEETIREGYSNVSFLGYEEFGNIHGSSMGDREAVAMLGERLRDRGVDAAIIAVGA
jgi:hypothetical protein